MRFNISSQLSYSVRSPSTIIFNVHALRTPSQTVLEETFTVESYVIPEEFVSQSGENRFVRIATGTAKELVISYRALVDRQHQLIEPDKLKPVAVKQMNASVIPFLFPSRYCQSDKLSRLAWKLFGNIPDTYQQVVAITDWIFENVEYVTGSTNAQTSAFDTVTERSGVCRDFAHLGISLCRALTIPARYFTGYAHQLQPADFHACFEAFIGERWLLFDATRLAPLNGLVRIATGRDAADAAVATIFGDVVGKSVTVSCDPADGGFQPLTHEQLTRKGFSLDTPRERAHAHPIATVSLMPSQLKITHETVYDYVSAVSFGAHRLILRPREGHDLQVASMSLDISPAYEIRWSRDVFGNSVATVTFKEPATQLRIVSRVVVNTGALPPLGEAPHHPVAFPVTYDPEELFVADAYRAQIFPEDASAVTTWVQQVIGPADHADAASIVGLLNAAVNRKIGYVRRYEKGVQSPAETLAKASGSCRDMATLLMEACRTLGMASRFSSGYLDCAASIAGTASTHAWAEVYFPGRGWSGFDPTIGEETSRKHVAIGVSNHPRAVMPVSGRFFGTRTDCLGMKVAVQFERLVRGTTI